MTRTGTPARTPGDLVRMEIAGFRALLKLLDAEGEALRRADAEALRTIAAAKMEQVGVLENLSRERTECVVGDGFPLSAAGIRSWLAAAEATAPVDRGVDAPAARDGSAPLAGDDAWLALIELAYRARQMNERNGRLMQRQRRHYDGALGALMQAVGVAPTYGADGRPQARAGGRALAAI